MLPHSNISKLVVALIARAEADPPTKRSANYKKFVRLRKQYKKQCADTFETNMESVHFLAYMYFACAVRKKAPHQPCLLYTSPSPRDS